MVRDDAERRYGLLLRSVPERGRGGIDQVTEQIGLEDAVDALQDAGHALEPQAGVDRGARQRLALVLRHLLELHEDEIPEFEEAIAILFGLPGGPPQMCSPRSIEDLRAGTAGPGVAHRPEIVRGRRCG